jgi:CheY-like chemotaxis protein
MQGKEAGRSLKVLVIEDNKDLATLLCSLLKIIGNTAVSANNGMEGLEKAKQDKPDVIFCDIGLPDMSGYKVAKQIRSEESLIDVFLVALTGYTEDRDIAMAMESGFNLHFAKPVNHAALQKIMSKFARTEKRG